MTVIDRIRDRTARVVVLGQGYVGLVLAMRASEAGFDVVGFDVAAERVARLRAGDSYIEDVSDAVLRAALDRGYVASDDPADLAGFDVAVISVPTPLHEGQPDLRAIEGATALVAAVARADTLVVLESTTYPGTTEELVATALADDVLVGYSPERIDPGNPTHGLHNTPKVVAGIGPAAAEATAAFFAAFVSEVVPVSSPRVAELAKLLENTFRHVNIALVNEMAMFAHDMDVDVFEAIDAAATKPFGFLKFTPGPGVGGHCLPIDPTYLSWRVKRHLGQTFRFVELANDVNEHMPHYVATRVQALLNDVAKPVRGSRVLVLGLSYKKNVGDAREAPSAPLVQRLLALGADVVAVDPHVTADATSVPLHPRLTADLLASADLAVLVVDHDAFDYDLLVASGLLTLDTRNCASLAGAPHVQVL